MYLCIYVCVHIYADMYAYTKPVAGRCRANLEYIRQSRPAYDLGFQVEVFDRVQVVTFSLASGFIRAKTLLYNPATKLLGTCCAITSKHDC